MFMLELVRGTLNSNTRKLKARNLHFLHCTVLQQIISMTKAIRFFIEFGTAERLGERTEHCMAIL